MAWPEEGVVPTGQEKKAEDKSGKRRPLRTAGDGGWS